MLKVNFILTRDPWRAHAKPWVHQETGKGETEPNLPVSV